MGVWVVVLSRRILTRALNLCEKFVIIRQCAISFVELCSSASKILFSQIAKLDEEEIVGIHMQLMNRKVDFKKYFVMIASPR